MKHIAIIAMVVGLSCLGFSLDILIRHPGENGKLAVTVAIVGYLLSALSWWLRGRMDANTVKTDSD